MVGEYAAALRISIHAPREGCDHVGVRLHGHLRISIHAPREGCDHAASGEKHGVQISIHAPREGRDATTLAVEPAPVQFQSTHPVRGATIANHVKNLRVVISIHAPREGCDRGNGLRIPRYGHSDHSLASIVLYNPLASPPDTQICRIEIPANHPLFSYQTARRTYTVFKSPQPWCEQPGTS